ncbi:MAG: GNAT family N-acetyltransferase [Pirellulales bacterium]|nr:GNAT family N-acetyltransferase [Pirellulales bacterium]
MRKKIVLPNGLAFVLRPPEPQDVKQIYAAACASRKELSPWMPWCHADYSEQDSANWIELCTKSWQDGTGFGFVMMDKAEAVCLGTGGLNHVNSQYRSANLGYWVNTSFAGQGIATAAARQVAKFGFTEQNLMRIEILTDPENKKSQRVAEKLGAVREGIKRNGLVYADDARDAIRYSLIPSDLGKLAPEA